MSHITTCLTCGKLYEEFSEESASAPNERECGTCWMKREEAEHEAREPTTDASSENPKVAIAGLAASQGGSTEWDTEAEFQAFIHACNSSA